MADKVPRTPSLIHEAEKGLVFCYWCRESTPSEVRNLGMLMTCEAPFQLQIREKISSRAHFEMENRMARMQY